MLRYCCKLIKAKALYLQTKRFVHLFPCLSVFLFFTGFSVSPAQATKDHLVTKIVPVADGWARNSVNAVIFRQNSLTTFRESQYTAFYDRDGFMVLAKRERNSSTWEINKTQYRADVEDAHNSISIEVDGNGVLHISWGLHGENLLYAQSKEPESIELGDLQTMTGKNEDAVTYPAFYRLAGGDLLFMYRQGISGAGNIMLNRYDSETKLWKFVAHPLIDGEGERNAYMNSMAIDDDGGWHLSWTWRETWDVATNHDIMYTFSPDEGKTWLRSDGNKYTLPVTFENAEVIYEIAQGSQLINQTSMTINSEGEPVIATYWLPDNSAAPQYNIIWQNSGEWTVRQISNRNLSFSLSGGGTKRIPISRPQIITGENQQLHVIYRDFEQGGGISVATSTHPDYREWDVMNIYHDSVEMWEPTYDPHAWKEYGELHLFVQKVGQGDGCLLYTSPSPRDLSTSRMPSSA